MPKKQKDGRYRAKITIDGQPVYVSAHSKRELDEKKAYVRAHYRDGVRPRDLTIHALVLEWFNTFKRPRIKAASTLNNYLNVINLHILPYFSDKQLVRAVRRADLQKCLDAASGYCSLVSSLALSVLRHAFDYALTENMISVDPTRGLLLPEHPHPTEKDAFTPEQVDSILRVASSSPDGLMLYLLYYLGLRKGEMLGLQWGDFDWQKQMVHIQRDIDHNDRTISAPVVGDLKSAAADRWVPVPDVLRDILLPLRSLPHLYLVSTRNGTPLTSTVYRTRFTRLMLECGFAHLSDRYHKRCDQRRTEGKKVLSPNLAYDYDLTVTAHWFRHNYITALVDAGVPAEVTMRIVGHADYQTTINIYTHISEIRKRVAVIKLSDVFASKVAEKLPTNS